MFMDKKKLQTALVTGASSGIGESLCRELVSRGWRVVGVARSIDKLQRVLFERVRDALLDFALF